MSSPDRVREYIKYRDSLVMKELNPVTKSTPFNFSIKCSNFEKCGCRASLRIDGIFYCVDCGFSHIKEPTLCGIKPN